MGTKIAVAFANIFLAKIKKEIVRQSTTKPIFWKRFIVTQYHPALPNLKDTLVGRWHLIENQAQLREIFKEPLIISYRKGKSLKDILVKAKL